MRVHKHLCVSRVIFSVRVVVCGFVGVLAVETDSDVVDQELVEEGGLLAAHDRERFLAFAGFLTGGCGQQDISKDGC